MLAVLALGVAALCASGPLITLQGLPLWWTIAVTATGILSILLLALVHCTDPGIIPARPVEDPLIAELERKAAAQRSQEGPSQQLSYAAEVQHDGNRYRLLRFENVWTRLDAGAGDDQRAL